MNVLVINYELHIDWEIKTSAPVYKVKTQKVIAVKGSVFKKINIKCLFVEVSKLSVNCIILHLAKTEKIKFKHSNGEHMH